MKVNDREYQQPQPDVTDTGVRYTLRLMNARVISTAEFSRRFRDTSGWAILAGSAVSSGPPTSAPMAGEAIRGFLSAVTDICGRVSAPLAREYRSVLDSLPGHALARNLKFELALSRIYERNPKLLKETVRRIFGGRPYNHNHQAIATLSRRGWATWLLTTNFDDGFEATGGFDGFVINEADRQAVIKLHGDANSGSGLIATIEALASAESAARQSKVFSDLQQDGLRSLLVVGYSGTGDLDIVPALNQAIERGLHVWWVVREGSRHRPIVPVEVAGTVEADLLSSSPKRNVLLALADELPIESTLGKPADRTHETSIQMAPVLSTVDFRDLADITVSWLLDANLGWQAARLLTAGEQALSYESAEQWSLACERMSAYSIASKYLTRVSDPDLTHNVGRLGRLAFLLQEAGRISRSRALYRKAAEGLAALREANPPFEIVDFVRRGHLESNLELCASRWLLTTRRRLVDELGLTDECAELLRLSRTVSPSVYGVLRLRRAQIAYLVAGNQREREAALREGGNALADALRLQHADAEGNASRFLLAGGRIGRDLRRTTRESFQGVATPPRDRFKEVPAWLQGYVPNWAIPVKMQLPFVGLIKRTVDIQAVLRFHVMRQIWRLRILVNS